jgi:hypothetical protein
MEPFLNEVVHRVEPNGLILDSGAVLVIPHLHDAWGKGVIE